jgi:hypothetical protein
MNAAFRYPPSAPALRLRAADAADGRAIKKRAGQSLRAEHRRPSKGRFDVTMVEPRS